MKKITGICLTAVLLLILSSCTYTNSMNAYYNQSKSQSAGQSQQTSEDTSTPAARVFTEYSKLDQFKGATEEELQPYFERIIATVEDFYKAAAASEEFPDFELATTDALKEYLEVKFKYETRFGDMSRKPAIALAVFEIAEFKVVDDVLWCDVSMRFPSFGNAAQIIIENPSNPTITDWHVGGKEGFDVRIRGFFLDLKKAENRLDRQNIDEVLSKGNEIIRMEESWRKK